jgi:hypothetical protein
MSMLTRSPICTSFLHRSLCLLALAAALVTGSSCTAQTSPAPNPAPDVLVLSNGDTLHGKFVSEMDGKVTFHSDPLGDVTLDWDKIKELHTSQKFAVLDGKMEVRSKKAARHIPVGTLEVANQSLTLHPENAAAEPPIPVKSAHYIMDQPSSTSR